MASSLKLNHKTHFAFGENWRGFAKSIDQARIDQAERGLLSLVDRDHLVGKTFLDIGCGSGLHTLAALRLGVGAALAVDFDPLSVATAESVLSRHWQGGGFEVIEGNILAELHLGETATFDVVYSWGVLHHTGDMWEAIRRAACLVTPDGKLIIAIYKKTPLCGFWKVEKRIYRCLPKPFALLMLYPFCLLFVLALLAQGRSPKRYVDEYLQKRGQRWMTDMHDWLGGYPYESANRDDIERFLATEGFTLERVRGETPPPLFGLFGSGCAEYVFRRVL